MKIETSILSPRATRIRFADTPGTVTFEDGWVRDHATLQVMAPAKQVGVLLKDMRHLAEDAEVPYDEKRVQIKRSEFASAVTTDGPEYYIASYRVPVKNAQEHLRALASRSELDEQSHDRRVVGLVV